MRVGDLEHVVSGDVASVRATVDWEDCDRPRRVISIETDARFAADLSPEPNAFLLASIIPAMRHGEQRIRIEGTVCPRLRDGLFTAMEQLRCWYGDDQHHPVAIEAVRGFEAPWPRATRRVGSLMSGGIDSMTTLRANRLAFPLDHPVAVQDCIYVHGFDMGGYEDLPKNREVSRDAIASLSAFAAEVDATLVPVFSDMRYLDDCDGLFAREAHGAFLAAIGHTLKRRITDLLIPSSYAVEQLEPWGSHPLIDPNYSSGALEVRHDGLRYSRLEKVALVADWEPALRTLRPCFDAFRTGLACGRCEKCLRTMAALEVIGKLKDCPVFSADGLTADMLRGLQASPPSELPAERGALLREYSYYAFNDSSSVYWRQLAEPLRRCGRDDLAEVVEEKLAEYQRWAAWLEDAGLSGALRRLDRRYTGGRGYRLYQRARGRR